MHVGCVVEHKLLWFVMSHGLLQLCTCRIQARAVDGAAAVWVDLDDRDRVMNNKVIKA